MKGFLLTLVTPETLNNLIKGENFNLSHHTVLNFIHEIIKANTRAIPPEIVLCDLLFLAKLGLLCFKENAYYNNLLMVKGEGNWGYQETARDFFYRQIAESFKNIPVLDSLSPFYLDAITRLLEVLPDLHWMASLYDEEDGHIIQNQTFSFDEIRKTIQDHQNIPQNINDLDAALSLFEALNLELSMDGEVIKKSEKINWPSKPLFDHLGVEIDRKLYEISQDYREKMQNKLLSHIATLMGCLPGQEEQAAALLVTLIKKAKQEDTGSLRLLCVNALETIINKLFETGVQQDLEAALSILDKIEQETGLNCNDLRTRVKDAFQKL